jgi:hypothetical protein
MNKPGYVVALLQLAELTQGQGQQAQDRRGHTCTLETVQCWSSVCFVHATQMQFLLMCVAIMIKVRIEFKLRAS